MKQLHLLLFMAFFALLHACSRDISCENCKPDIPKPKTDTLSADYPFSKGYCAGTRLGINIPGHDSAKFSGTDLLPDSLQLEMPVPGNQQNQQSCAAWATIYYAGSYYNHTINGKAYSDSTNLSPKYTYNQITHGNCTCTSITDNLYLLQTQGACSLADMPYRPDECLLQPDSLQRKKAAPFKIKDWLTVDLSNIMLIKQQLLHKAPVIFSAYIDAGFQNLKAPFIWSQPTGNGEAHAMVICGYDDKRKAFRIVNSWSIGWADKGFAWIDYSYFVRSLAAPVGYIIIY